MLHDTAWTSVVHDFCSNCLTIQREGSLSLKRQQSLITYKRNLLLTERGRSQPLGTDLCGRIYWLFAQQTNQLIIQLTTKRPDSDSQSKSTRGDRWLCFYTLPSVAQ